VPATAPTHAQLVAAAAPAPERASVSDDVTGRSPSETAAQTQEGVTR